MFNDFRFSQQGATTGNFQRRIVNAARFNFYSHPSSNESNKPVVNRPASYDDRDVSDIDQPKLGPPLLYLAPREKEVLLWAAQGKSAWETAQMLNLSEKTIKFYIRNACSRLKVQNKTHAVAVCVSAGLFRI